MLNSVLAIIATVMHALIMLALIIHRLFFGTGNIVFHIVLR